MKLGASEAAARVAGDHLLRDAALGLGIGLMAVGATSLASGAFAVVRRAEQALAEALGPLSTPQCLALALVSGIAEELLFRGVLQPLLGIAITSAIFGLAHVPVRRELWGWPLFAGAMGLILGLLARETGALLAPIFAHVTVNAVNLRLISPRPGGPAPAAF
jgi:hypothetical protein